MVNDAEMMVNDGYIMVSWWSNDGYIMVNEG